MRRSSDGRGVAVAILALVAAAAGPLAGQDVQEHADARVVPLDVSPDDVPPIVAAVIQAQLPPDLAPDGKRVGGRPIHLDTAATARAFRRGLAPALAGELGATEWARDVVVTHQDVAECPDGLAGGCSIPGDGFVVSVREAGPWEDAGEMRLWVRVRWIGPMGQLHGYGMELFVAKLGRSAADPEARWAVVGRGRAVAG